MMSSRPGSARSLWATRSSGQGLWTRPSLAKAALAAFAVAALFVLLSAGMAWAGDPTGAATGGAAQVAAKSAGAPTTSELAAGLGHVQASLNLFFVIFGGALVFFMQAGFALVETASAARRTRFT